jgi:signal transduction histidine kinase
MTTASPLPLSLFALLREQFGENLPLLRCTKATLVHLSHTIEDLVLANRLPALLFTGFQESSHWRKETERYRALAEVAQQVCIFAGGNLPPESSASQLHVVLGGDDPLRQEWFLALLSEEFAVLLCGQDQHIGAKSEALRQFDTIFTFDPQVIDQVLDRLEQVIGQYRPERLAQLQAARRTFPPSTPKPEIISHFTREMIRFEEQLHHSLAATTSLLDSQLRWRDDLTATLVHDLRSPLQGLGLALNMLQSKTDWADAKPQDILQIAQSSVRNMAVLIQLILDTNQLASGQFDLNWQGYEPKKLLDDAIEPLQPLLQRNKLELAVMLDERVTTVWGDGDFLTRITQNLLGNAIKFTSAGKRISINVAPAPSGRHIEISVHDTGPGIAPADLEHIFDRYYQADKRAHRGNGLGLYFCQLAAEAHGGQIRAASQLGVGTTFTVVLPSEPPLSALGQ